MKRVSMLGLALLSSMSSYAQDMTQLSTITRASVEGTNILWVDSVTLPLYVQHKIAPTRQVDFSTYLQKIWHQDVPKDYYNAYTKTKRDEFERREGMAKFEPWVQEQKRWAQKAQYLLIAVRVDFGEYNFDTKSLPISLRQYSHIQLGGSKNIGGYCVGYMWPVPSSPYKGEGPCVAINRVSSLDDRAFTHLTMEPEQARRLKERAQAVFNFNVLARYDSKPSYAGKLGEDYGSSYHVLDVEPVAFYVYERDSGKVIARAAAIPSGRDKGATGTQGRSKLETVTPSNPVSGPANPNDKPRPTLKIN
jgi:hypothetical protein